MKKINAQKKMVIRGAVALCAGALFAIGGVTAANATTVYPPEGGTWTYYADASTVVSQYQHPSKTHKATACNNSSCNYSGWYQAGSLATAVKQASLWGNTAYYGVKL